MKKYQVEEITEVDSSLSESFVNDNLPRISRTADVECLPPLESFYVMIERSVSLYVQRGRGHRRREPPLLSGPLTF